MNTQFQQSQEGIDADKLLLLLRRNIWVIIGIFIVTNLVAYLTLRWTKDVYESASELKLEIKNDATELGIKQMVEDQNRNIIAGEIEQLKSKLFFSRVIDSLDLWVSYFSKGNVLEFEMYRGSPFRITYSLSDNRLLNRPIYFDFLEGNRYRIRESEKTNGAEALLGESVEIGGGTFRAELAPHAKPDFENQYYFVINSRERLIDFLSANLNVEPINWEANTIRISLRDYNPVKVYTVVNKIDSVYLYYSNEQKNQANRQKIDWLNNELAQVEVKMENFEDYFENFTLKNKSSNADADLRKTIMLINAIDSQRFELTRKVKDLDDLMTDLSADHLGAAMIPRTYLPEYVNKRIEEYVKTKQDQSRLTLSYKDNTYAYQQKEQEVNTLRNTVLSQMKEIRKNWLIGLTELNQKKDRLEREFATMPDKNTQYSKNQRFYKLYEEFYLSMMQAKAQFEIAQAGSTPNFKILSSATLPLKPVAPNRYLILGIGLVAGLVLNFFYVALVLLLNDRVTSIMEVEKLTKVPVLGVIPEMLRKSTGPFYIVEHPRSVVSEAIRTLRTNLDFFTTPDSGKVISISSTVSGEGKSFLAMNLGGILALSRKKVVLLDLDMRKAKNGQAGGESARGISTILIQRNSLEECIRHTDLEGFDFIPAGPHPPNPSELLMNGEFEGMIQSLKKKYDYVVIDTPPVGLVTDAIMAMRRSDLSIYVVRANYTKREFLKNLERLVTINKLSHVAVVLNALPGSSKTYGYGYYQEDGSQKNWIRKRLRI